MIHWRVAIRDRLDVLHIGPGRMLIQVTVWGDRAGRGVRPGKAVDGHGGDRVADRVRCHRALHDEVSEPRSPDTGVSDVIRWLDDLRDPRHWCLRIVARRPGQAPPLLA